MSNYFGKCFAPSTPALESNLDVLAFYYQNMLRN